jgi:hypothetical protein
MRSWTFAILSSAALALSAAPAEAAWKTYISKEFGFSFIAPGEIKGEFGTSRGAIAGPRQTFVFKSVEDNIEYKVTVLNFPQAQMDGADILGERAYMFQDGKNVLMDTFGRVEPGKDSVYGRKLVVDLPDKKGRSTGAFYFYKGRLISLEATVLPANGDYESPDPGRFIDSIVFVLSRTEQGAVELQIPKNE